MRLVSTFRPGVKLVSTSAPGPRRRTKAELRRMSHEDRLHYHIHARPMTELEREEELRREDDIARYQLDGDDVLPGSRLWDDGPPDEDDLQWK